MSALLREGKLRVIRQWFYNADGVVYPYLISGYEDLSVVDRLTRYALEGCASNYSHFMSSLKKTKKLIRKEMAINNPRRVVVPGNLGPVRQHLYYVAVFNSILDTITSKAERFRLMLLWTQSRGTGLASADMVEKSFHKFRDTVTQPCLPLEVDPVILRSCIRAQNVTGHEAQASVGPKSCLQSPQAPEVLEDRYYLPGSRKDPVGGQTRYLLYLASHRVIREERDLQTLEATPCEPRPVRSAPDLLIWATNEAVRHGALVRSVRFHCVEEQSKARSITVANLAYQVIMGAMAHALVPAVYSAETKAGLSKDRNLWRFLHDQLAPDNPGWDGFTGHGVSAYCTDLSEATDFGNWWLARAIWSELIRQTAGRNQPLGLMLLAKSLYCSPRPVFHRSGKGVYSYITTRRGFLMGDLFTKLVLTIGQDYNVRLALMSSPLGKYRTNANIVRRGTLRPYNNSSIQGTEYSGGNAERPRIVGASYSIVGDDVVLLYAVLSQGFSMGEHFHAAATSGGWKLSEDDTFDSRHLMFYCEEGSLIPRGPHYASRHSIWRGRQIGYLDYPRIRLMMPVKVETNLYSHTNVGRFALMGKECLWTLGTAGQAANEMYSRASILQHLMVPRDIETLCPYTPQEIGGDGAYTPDWEFFSQIINVKSKDSAETLYRMQRQMTHTWAHRFVSSDKPRGGVLKQHLILPTLDRLKQWIPERSLITPESPEHAELYSALPRGILESPQLTFFKLVKRVYNSHLFRGIHLPTLIVRSDLSSKRGQTSAQELWAFFLHQVDGGEGNNICYYLETWRRPGFQYRNTEPYYVVPERHRDVMSLGWNWRFRPERPTEISRLDVHSFLDVIRHGRDVPLIVDRLNLFFESDPLIMIRVRERPEIRGLITLISRDKRLAFQICKWVRTNRDRTARVQLVSPEFFFLGRIDEFPSSVVLQDAGAINFLGRNISESNLSDVECNQPVLRYENSFPGVSSVYLDGYRYPSRGSARLNLFNLMSSWNSEHDLSGHESDVNRFLDIQDSEELPPYNP